MESYLDDKKKLYTTILEFLDPEEEDQNSSKFFQELANLIKNQKIDKNKEEMKQFLQIIKSISDNHHLDQQFNQKINKILNQFKNQIKQTLSNNEIYQIFKNNKKIVLFLLKNNIITISDLIYKDMINKLEANGQFYWHFFIPELENFIGEGEMKIAKDELLKENPNFFDDYEDKRKEGENDSYICSLIRDDSVVEFISYICRNSISLSSQIAPSIFETNSFLIENENTTLIEYSAFFGSIEIFNYLLNNEVEFTPSLCLYLIHSKKPELIHLIESNYFKMEQYIQCFIESIKCHHNIIANYITESLLIQDQISSQKNKEILLNCIKYHNYMYIQADAINEYGFFYLCFYQYDTLVNHLYKRDEKAIEKKAI